MGRSVEVWALVCVVLQSPYNNNQLIERIGEAPGTKGLFPNGRNGNPAISAQWKHKGGVSQWKGGRVQTL